MFRYKVMYRISNPVTAIKNVFIDGKVVEMPIDTVEIGNGEHTVELESEMENENELVEFIKAAKGYQSVTITSVVQF